MARKKNPKQPARPKVTKPRVARPKVAKPTVIKSEPRDNVIQTVNVVLPDTKRRVATRRRAPRAEPMMETITAKTLAPVFIQPPVASQQNPYDFQELGKAVGEVAFRTLYDKLPMAKPISKKVDVPEVILSSKSVAEPFVKGDVLDGDKIVTPVPPSASENPTTSVDSTYKVAEAYGFVSDKQPTGDVAVNSDFKQGMGMSVGVSSQDVPNNFDEPAFFSTEAPAQKSKEIMSRIKEATITDILTIPKNIDTTGWTREQAKKWIKDTVQREQLSPEEFKKKYIMYDVKRQQTREVVKYKAGEFDKQFKPADTSNITNIFMETPKSTGMVQTVTSSTSNFV